MVRAVASQRRTCLQLWSVVLTRDLHKKGPNFLVRGGVGLSVTH